MMTDEQKFGWYRRRCKALEDLLVVYRMGGRPTTKLFTELDRTRKYIDDMGVWRTEAEATP